MATAEAKANGSYYTPTNVAHTLVRWVVRRKDDVLLDPSCGDGQFLSHHRNSIGVDQDQRAAIAASSRAPGSVVHVEDFFSYADQTKQRFDCIAGNPPFIRYQRFAGEARRRALELCHRIGAPFSALSSSWAPFIAAASSLLKPGGRMAFVIPAEIGHAPYAAPLLTFLMESFGSVQIVAIRESVFPQLSQDVWLLYAENYGESSDGIALTAWDDFRPSARPPRHQEFVSREEWMRWGSRLRPFLLPLDSRLLYRRLIDGAQTYRMGNAARVGIGYVTGANEFFHLRPSEAKDASISKRYLLSTVRSGRVLPPNEVSNETVSQWIDRDEPCLLLRLQSHDALSIPVRRYLDSTAGRQARKSYKCSNRAPWYVVPDVTIPDGFLTYMSGAGPALVKNAADCTCTNSIHAVRMNGDFTFAQLQKEWEHPLTRLSAEIEGHPLGGGMLKIEPREASRIAIPYPSLQLSKYELQLLQDARAILRQWRHYE